MPLLHLQPPIKDHQPRNLPHNRPLTRPRRRRAVIKPLPRQHLPLRKQQQKETTPPQPRQDQAQPQPPQRPRGKHLPAGMRATERRERAGQDDDEAGDGEDDAEHGGDAESFERAVADAEADEVAVGAVAEEAVDVVGDGLEGRGVRGGLEFGDGLLAEGGGQVEFLFGAGAEEEVDDGVELAAGDGGGGAEELGGGGGGVFKVGALDEGGGAGGFGGAEGVAGDEMGDAGEGFLGLMAVSFMSRRQVRHISVHTDFGVLLIILTSLSGVGLLEGGL